MKKVNDILGDTRLETCPFCGVIPTLREYDDIGKYKILCENTDCLIRSSTAVSRNPFALADQWNTRRDHPKGTLGYHDVEEFYKD